MEAKLIRSRHYKSSVGTLLNENYDCRLPQMSTKLYLPKSVHNDNISTETRQCSNLIHSHQTAQLSSTESHRDVNTDKDIKHNIFETTDNVFRTDDELLFDWLDSSPYDLYRTPSKTPNSSLTKSRDSSGVDLSSIPVKLSAYSSASARQSRPPSSGAIKTDKYRPFSSTSTRQSRPPTADAMKTDKYRPFSSTSTDFVQGKLKFSPLLTPEITFRSSNIQPPQYYDAYREIMDYKPSSAYSSSFACKLDANNNIEPIKNTILQDNVQYNSKSNAPKSGCVECIELSKKTPGVNVVRSASQVSDRSSLRHENNVSVNVNHFYSRPKGVPQTGKRNTLSRASLNIQEPIVFYSGRTPSRTPTPDYRLPVFPSQAWTKHYSPTRIRFFLKAVADGQ